MHEFSLAQDVFEIVRDTARANGVSFVSEVTLEIGTLSGVEFSAMETAIESLQSGSAFEKTKFIIRKIKAEAVCRHCSKTFEPEDIFSLCPKCGNYGIDIISGRELLVKSITAE
ncbi:MAG: hydrogenase maturation nickel metallochaperone HypA [Bacteroidales bacterium]|nr:hydrogenase maturation nickel metallochaperone HypA [Bacteroidales bacterium]